MLCFARVYRDDHREGRRVGRGALIRGRVGQVIGQESVEEHVRGGSAERLDANLPFIHPDIATLSYEVRSIELSRSSKCGRAVGSLT